MPEIDLFDFYRRLLVLLVGSYGAVRLVVFIWRWRAGGLAAGRYGVMLRRWVESSALRIRLRRFSFDALQIVLLGGILAYLLCLQVEPGGR